MAKLPVRSLWLDSDPRSYRNATLESRIQDIVWRLILKLYQYWIKDLEETCYAFAIYPYLEKNWQFFSLVQELGSCDTTCTRCCTCSLSGSDCLQAKQNAGMSERNKAIYSWWMSSSQPQKLWNNLSLWTTSHGLCQIWIITTVVTLE